MKSVDNNTKLCTINSHSTLLVKSSSNKLTNIETMCWYLLGALFIFSNITKHSVIFQVVSLMFIFGAFIYLFQKRALRLNKFYIITIFFIVYNWILVSTGGAINATHSYKMIKTISINLILVVFIYSFLIYTKNTDRLLKIYIYTSVVNILVILFVYRENLLSGRLAFSWGDSINYYKFLGINIRTSGPNGIAFFSFIAFIFSTYIFLKKEKKIKYLIFNFLFVFTILITGSRKGIFNLILGFIVLLNILYKGNKRIVYLTIGTVLCFILYFLCMEVPVLYEIIGQRIDELINLVSGKVVNDGSINTRMSLIDMAKEFYKVNPIFGYGLDAFRIMCPWGIISDNNYLEILVSSGIIGFIIYYMHVIFVFYDYSRIKNKSYICKILFWIFILILLMQYGSVVYFERNFDFIYVMLFYILRVETYQK